MAVLRKLRGEPWDVSAQDAMLCQNGRIIIIIIIIIIS